MTESSPPPPHPPPPLDRDGDLYEARITRAHQAVSVWPYVTQYNEMPGDGSYARFLSNDGLGPARVGAFEVRVDGEPVRTWGEAARRLLGEEVVEAHAGEGQGSQYASVRRGGVILPGRRVRLLYLPPGPLAGDFADAMGAGRVALELCYCSLYDACWLSHSEAPEPERVRRCEADPAAAFAQ